MNAHIMPVPDAGVAVLSVMLVTTCLVSLVMLIVWETPLLLVLPFTAFFLVLEGVYFSANIIKASPDTLLDSCQDLISKSMLFSCQRDDVPCEVFYQQLHCPSAAYLKLGAWCTVRSRESTAP